MAKLTIEEKVKKAKEKEKLKKEISKIKEKKEPKKEKLSPSSIAEFTETISNVDIIDEQEELLSQIKNKEELFLSNFFLGKEIPTKVYTYDYNKSCIEYDIDNIIIVSKEKPIIRNNSASSQNTKLRNYLNDTILTVDNVNITYNYNKNIKLKYKYNDIINNKFMFFEKKKKSELIYNKK